MNKSCPRCHQTNPPEAAFCLNCATPLPGANYGGGNWQANQQYNQANYGGQNFAQSPGDQGGASQRAIAALGLSIAGLFCLGPLALIPATIIGWMEMSAIKQGQAAQAGMWMAMVGFWGGIILTVLQVGVFAIWILLAVAQMSAY